MTETFNITGLEPGTVVITRTAVNALLEPFSEQVLVIMCIMCSIKAHMVECRLVLSINTLDQHLK